MGKLNCQKNDQAECIQKKAYELWQKDGCKQGRDQDYWLIAEKKIQTPARRNNKKEAA